MQLGDATSPPDLARALRSQLAVHNLRVALLTALTLVAAVVLWYLLYIAANWLALLFVTAVEGTEARLPSVVENAFWFGAAALLALAWVDRQLRPDDRPKDYKSATELVLEVALAIPRLTLSVWGTLSAWLHLDRRELAEAAHLVTQLGEHRRLRLQSLPLEIPNSERRFKILFALQMVQIIDVRREDRELWVALNPLRPKALRLADPAQA
ncbi:MAG: hypothetical protein WCF18_21950 [Chthoniobacteraceae bacterium]